jgi:phosphonate transport system substrate-binding protein
MPDSVVFFTNTRIKVFASRTTPPGEAIRMALPTLLPWLFAATLRLQWLGLFLVAAATYAEPVAQGARSLTVAVVPQFTALQIHKDWTPFLERVSHDSGVPLTLKIYPTIPKFEADVLKGVPDLVFMNPYHQVMARRAAGYLPLVRDSKPLTGILLVRRDNSARTLKDLAGAKVVFPAPNAFGASLYMRALLAENERIRIEPAYVKTHPNVFRQVIAGEAVAGGTVNSVLQREPPTVIEQLRVLFETPAVAPHPLAVHPRIAPAQRKAVAEAILKMRDDATAAPLLQAVQMADPVAADYVRDYLPLEQLKLEKYVVTEAE